jgi:hypothetical protein
MVKHGTQIKENSYQKQKIGNMMEMNVDIYVNSITRIIQKAVNVNQKLEHKIVEEIFQTMQQLKMVIKHISKHGVEQNGSQQSHGHIMEMFADLHVIQITI